MGIISKLWRRRVFVAKAAENWAVYFSDVVTLRNKGNPKGKKIIVFVRAISDIRLFKEAVSLRKTVSFYTVFFTKVIDYKLMRPAFDEIHPFISIEGLAEKIRALSLKSEILAIHVSSPPANICRRLIEMKLPWPIIFDQYDSYLVENGPDYKGDSSERMYDLEKQIEDEKFCYENADGVVAKTTEIDYVKSILNVTCPTLIYPDYALEDWFVEPQEPIRTADGRPHLVYAGGVDGRSVSDDIGFSKFFDFAENLNDQKIHFHIYPNPGQTVPAKEYAQLAEELPFFHFHNPQKPWEIQKEIAQYDFSLDVAWKGMRNPQKDSTATGVKFGTYLEAALPIIVNKGIPNDAKKITNGNLGFIIENDRAIIPENLLKLRKEYQANVLVYREKFSCENHITKLINLYEQLILKE
jgi:hypothetical protein